MEEKIKTVRELSQEVHKIRDKHAEQLIKIHNKYWKNIDINDEKIRLQTFLKLSPELINEILECLEEVIALVLHTLQKSFDIKNNVILNVEDLLYSEDGKTLIQRLYEYYIVQKGQSAVYNLIRLINTETEYVFSGAMQDKIDVDKYDAFLVDNDDGTVDCDEGCPEPGTILPINATKPPYHPDCECFWVPLTKEEIANK